MNQALTLSEFSVLLEERFSAVLAGQRVLAMGLSGGPDSMALAWLFSLWAAERGIAIHAFTVDHGLRLESAEEAKSVAGWVSGWKLVHHIIKWEGEKPGTRIQEEARHVRYALMEAECRKVGAKALFLAHHQNDQAETFLMRLAKGSGLDGLAAMRPVHQYSGHMIFLRPFLSVPKERLLATCAENSIPYVLDPSNNSDHFARVRLRKSLAALEVEGLTSKRLALTAERLERASQALDIISEKLFQDSVRLKGADRIVYDNKAWKDWPPEIVFRVLVRGMKILRTPGDYLPRMEKIESVLADAVQEKPFTKRTLGGLIFERSDADGTFAISIENKDKNPQNDV